MRSKEPAIRSVVLANRRGWIVAGSQRMIHVWRLDGSPVVSIGLARSKALLKTVVSPDASRAVALEGDHVARVYALPSGRPLYRLTHDGTIEDAAFSRDGRWIVTGGYAGHAGGVRLWDARSGHLERQIVGALRHVHDVAFSRDGKLVAGGGSDGTARVWETATGVQLAIMIGHTNEVTSVDFNQSGTALVSSSSDGTARVWVASGGRAGRLVHVLAGHRSPVVAAVFAPDGRSVLTGGEDGTARFWDPGSEPPLTLLARSPFKLNGLAVRASGRRIAVGRQDGVVEIRTLDGRLIRRESGALPDRLRVVDPHEGVRAVAFGGSVKLIKRGARRSTHYLQHDGTVESVAFSPNGRLLVTASDDRDARIWDVESGRLVQRLHGHFGPVLDARFSPDGRWVVTAGPITAGLWLVGSDAPPIFLDAPVERPLSAAAFAGPDGRLVVATSRDGTLRSYTCDVCGDVHELMALAKRRLAAER
jgi:WD40 repeat protein